MNIKNNQKHTRVGLELMRKLSEEGKRIFTIQDARKAASLCGISNGYVVEALHHLTNTGWIARLKRGLYSISSIFPGMAPIHEFEIAMALVQPSAVSHWSALHFHGMTEQIPKRVYITTTKTIFRPKSDKALTSTDRKSGREINGIFYEVIKIKPERFFGSKDYWVGEIKVTITDPERTLLDGLMRPKYFGDWAEIYSAFKTHYSTLDVEKIINYSIRLGPATAKRLGWVLEKIGVGNSELLKLETISIQGYRILDPSGPRRGPCNKRWMIQENLPGKLLK